MTIEAPVVELDTKTVTLGELWAVEEASGRTIAQLVATTTGTLLMALFVAQLREHRASPSSASMPSWQELADRPLRAVSSSD